MATLYCRLGTGVSRYVVHASYSTAIDPYPNGATITTSQTLSNVKNNSTITIRADETQCNSGYTFPVYVYTSPDGSHWTQVDYLQSGTVTFNVGTGTKYVRVGPATAGTTSYKVKVVLGDGIKRVGYGVNTAAVSNLVSTGFTKDVGADGYLYITIADYLENYSYPVTASSGSSSWTVVNANGVYNDHYISAPSSPGTRTVTLTATKYKTYYYKVHVFANGGTFSDGGSDYYTGVASSPTVSIEYSLDGLKKPTRAGYTFLGWGYSSNATQYYTDTITISATSQSSGSPTIYNIYAIWTKTEYDAYIRMGAGISSMSVYVDGSLKADIIDNAYHRLTVNLLSTITVKGIAKKTGFGKPYTVKLFSSSTATTPTGSFDSNEDEVAYSYSSGRKYAEISAKKMTINLFYWDNATWDAANIKAGQPISNLTATRWNNLLAKIQELAEAEGGSYSYSGVSSGSTIYATIFNEARTAISNRTGYGQLPAAQVKGNKVKAALFEGPGSLKSALNAAINHYNNS